MTRTLAALTPAVVLALYAPSSPAQDLEPPQPMAPSAPRSPPPQSSSSGQPPSSPGPTNADEDSAMARADASALAGQARPRSDEQVWINADVGFSSVNLSVFDEQALSLPPVGTGPTFGVGVGRRLRWLTVGVRVRYALLSSLHGGGYVNRGGSFDLWELNAEAALHMRTENIDPYFGVRGGYALGSPNESFVPPDVSVNGFDVGPILGIDVYLSHLVSIGAEGDVEFLFVNRSQAQGSSSRNNPLYDRSVSSVGLGGGLTAHLGIHF